MIVRSSGHSMARLRAIAFIALVVFGFGFGCGGGCGGCAGMEPIPGGFAADKRHPNAAQVRVTSNALRTLEADPAALVSGFLGGGPLTFNLPSTCGSNPAICCPGGVPSTTCGPLNIDLTKKPGDDARLVLAPTARGAINGELGVTVRARLKTAMDIPVHIDLFGGVDCTVAIDTEPGNDQDIEVILPILFTQDGTVGTTRIGSGSVVINRLEDADIKLNGNFACQGANFVIGFFISTITTTIQDQIKNALDTQTCKQCPSGDVAECGSSFATKCTSNVCTKANDECLQELGIDGRMRGVAVLGGFSPGTTGAIDLYEVTGGYATSNANGLALGLLGGMEPGGTARDRCGPPATAPATGAIPQSVFFQGNVRPDTNTGFDVAIGVHKSQLSQFAFAGYDGGFLCLTVGSSTSDKLNTDTIGLLSRSLTKLVDVSAPVSVGLRPQAPPDIILGKNTFKDDGTGHQVVDDPLLDLTFHAMEIDFFAAVDDQFIRVFTLVSDVHLSINLQVTGMGQLSPVLGNTDTAFSNLSVKNSEAITEDPAMLAATFPQILGLVLPQLSSALPSVSLPAIGGLNLSVTAITAVPTAVGGPDNDFLAIFANLAPAFAPHPIQTTAELRGVDEPSAAIMNDPRKWASSTPPSVQLELGADVRDVEWSIRLDHGSWSAWSANPRPTLSPRTFFLAGQHVIEVRGRQLGKPETIDLTPEVIAVEIGVGSSARTPVNGFHGQPGQAGCNCEVGGSSGDAAPLVLVLGVVVLPLGGARRRVARVLRALARHVIVLGPIVWIAALTSLPGCSCSSNPCGDAACLPGDIASGALGKWTSIAGDDGRVIVATYDKGLGDLVAVDATDPNNLVLTAVDGIPDGVPPTYDPSSYRKGVEDPGPDVGAHTSIALGDGLARIAYQDLDAKALRYAYETKKNQWKSYALDEGSGEAVGEQTAIAIDADGKPVVAYLAVGIDDGTGHRTTELRLARATAKAPASATDWTTVVVATGSGTCAGLCGGQSCIADATGQICAAATTDCTATCADTEVCVTGACIAKIVDPTVSDLPTGTGLFASIVVLPDARLAIAYYDRNARSLVLGVESAAGANTFAPVVLDALTPGDRGMWADAVVDASGTVHIAYQDALGDQLLYTTWNGTPGVPEVVDDGQRPGDRTHPVGAAASIYVTNGLPSIAYQDGLVADVYVADRIGAAWSTAPIAPGPVLDGFSIGVTTGHGGTPYFAWDQLVPANAPPHGLHVQTR